MTIVVELTEFVREHGLAVLLGSTAVLGVVSLAMACNRSYAAKRQLARVGLLALVGYGVLALVPMPRFSLLAESAGAAASVPVTRSEARDVGARDRLPKVAAPVEPSLLPFASMERRSDESSPAATVAATVSAPQQLPSPEPSAAGLDLAGLIAWGLLLGGSLFLAQLLIGWIALRRVCRGSREAVAAVREALGVPEHVRLSIARRSVRPFCCGLLRPRIVLPPELASTRDARFVVQHELAHLRAGDARWRTFAVLLRPLLFWQPLFWWLQVQLRFCGEVLADDAAAGGAVGDYVRSMTALASASRPRVLGAPAAFVFHRRTELFRRLEMMLKRGSVLSPVSRGQRLWSAASALLLVAACGATFGVERAVAQDPKREGHVAQLRAENAKLRQVNEDLRARLDALEQRTGDARDEFDDELHRVDGKRVVYVVRQGDTLAKIAKDLYGTPAAVDRLRALNPEVDPVRLRIGQELRIAGDPPPVNRAQPAPPSRPAAASVTARRSLDDVAKVTTRLIDLRGQVKIAEIQFARLRAHFERGTTPQHELEIAEVGLETKRKQREVIEKMLRIELESAQRELDRMKVLFEAGLVSSRETASLNSFVQVLTEVF